MRVLAAMVVVLGSLAILAGHNAASGRGPPDVRVLVLTKTAAYRHDSFPAAIATVERLGAQNGFVVDQTEDANAFTTTNLSRYRVVMFLLTTGDVLDADQQSALTHYVEAGGGFVGVHWKSHSAIEPGDLDVVDRATPSTLHLPTRWMRVDEWYAFDTDPSADVTVLTTLGAAPISWQHVYNGGRSWYTAMGHTATTCAELLFRRFLLGGILWAARGSA